MNTRIIMFAALLATALIAAVICAYVLQFGIAPAVTQGNWGTFGDYFGGILNPVFAMLAFVALLWSISLQASEFQKAAEHLSEQTRLAREEAEAGRRDKISRELLEVIRDIDSRIGAILSTEVSVPGAMPRLTVAHMASEAERLSNSSDASSSYTSFLEHARASGTLLEASARELLHLVEKMREFIAEYSNARQGSYAPVIVYYADKVFHLLHLVHDLGGAKGDTFQFFATVADPHG
jgi:uncharacterized membrane protein